MIQDILPHNYHVEFYTDKPQDDDVILIYKDNRTLIKENYGDVEFPKAYQIKNLVKYARLLFKIDEIKYFDLRTENIGQSDNRDELEGFRFVDSKFFRTAQPMWKAFSAITGLQMHNWYMNNIFCSHCGGKMNESQKERAVICPDCKRIVYPTIAPSVIVAITDGDRLLLTKYQHQHSSYRKYALVAGYVETGETLEDTVRREVMEEVGLRVKNIRYYKSQPWSFTDTLLMGFFCEVEGDTRINLEIEELKEARWFDRDDIPVNDAAISLTNEMIEKFRKQE